MNVFSFALNRAQGKFSFDELKAGLPICHNPRNNKCIGTCHVSTPSVGRVMNLAEAV